MENWLWITLMIVIYAFAMMGIGFIAEKGDKKSKNLNDYYLGGRSMGPILAIGAFMTTMLSSFALLGMPGYFYRYGVGSWFLIISNSMVMFLLYYPFVFRTSYLGHKHGFITLGDFMEARYDKRMRTASSISMIIVSVPYVAIQIQGFGNIFEGITHGKVPFELGALFLSIILTIYIFQGGYRAVALTDAVQGLLMVFALLIGGVYIANYYWGGIPGLFKELAVNNADRLTLPGGSGYWNMSQWANWMVFTSGIAVTPQIFQKFYTTRDETALRASLYAHPILTLIIYTGAMLIGLAGILLFPNLSALESDNITLLIVADHLPLAIGMIITVGIVAAAMSTADSQYLTISSLFVRDVYEKTICEKKGVKPEMDFLVKLGRWFCVVLLIVGFIIAYLRLDTLVGMLTNTVYPLGAQIFIPMVGGLYWKRANSDGALTGMLGGLIVVILTLFVPPFKSPLGIHAIWWGMLVNIILFVTVSLSTEKPSDEVIETMIDDVNNYVYNKNKNFKQILQEK